MKFTIAQVKMMHEMADGPFFKAGKLHGDKMSDWKVVHRGNRVFLEKKKIPLGASSPVYEFFPANGRIIFDSFIQN
jgi:hypothetical protein